MKNAIITILVIIVLAMGSFLVYDKLLKEDKKEAVKNTETNKTENMGKIEEEKELYYFEDTKPVATFSKCFENDTICESIKEKKEFVYKYPIININTDSIKSLNKYLKDKAEFYKQEFLNGLESETENKVAAVKVSDGSEKYTSEYTDIEYKIHQGKYLTILIETYLNVLNGSGSSKLENALVIDIENGKVLNNYEILEQYKFNENSIQSSFKSLYKELENDLEPENINEIIFDLSANNYHAFINKSGELTIWTTSPIPGQLLFVYNGSNWEIKDLEDFE